MSDWKKIIIPAVVGIIIVGIIGAGVVWWNGRNELPKSPPYIEVYWTDPMALDTAKTSTLYIYEDSIYSKIIEEPYGFDSEKTTAIEKVAKVPATALFSLTEAVKQVQVNDYTQEPLATYKAEFMQAGATYDNPFVDVESYMYIYDESAKHTIIGASISMPKEAVTKQQQMQYSILTRYIQEQLLTEDKEDTSNK